MALPPGLIQINGRRGYYVNITVPNNLRKAIGKAVIQKKRFLIEEQLKAQQLFDELKREEGPKQLRKLYLQLKQDEKAQSESDEIMLSAEETIDLIVDSKTRIGVDPKNPTKPIISNEDEALLLTAAALRKGLQHWEEWVSERMVTTRSVTPLVKKRWETVMKNLVTWAKDEYPSRITKQHGVEYKRHLLTRTSRTGHPPKQSTVAKELRDLSAFWNWAKRHEWASTNIWEGLASGLGGSEIQALPVRELVEAADQKAMAREDLMYLIQRFTGCRKQGVCGLRGTDIDLENDLIHFVEYREDGRIRKLKNGQEAHVPIHSKLRPFLEKAKPSMPDGAIWPNQYKPSEETWGDRYGDTFPDKYSFNSHDLRRIVETQMAEANISPYFAFYITGHRVPGTSKVTQQYVRPTAEELREIVEKIH
jgi:integrase